MSNAKAALIWITDILKSLNIPFQISGGLAAKSYGSQRTLADIDIDIPEDCFERVREKVEKFISYGPAELNDGHWNLLILALDKEGQAIELCGAHSSRFREKQTGIWHALQTDFSKCEVRDVLGLSLPVIPREELLVYKKMLARDVDLEDVRQFLGCSSFGAHSKAVPEDMQDQVFGTFL